MKRALFALAVLALSWPAQAQVYPNIPPNTFLGRLGAGQAGPPQPILFTAFPFGQVAPIKILPPAGTTQGLVITQTGPNGGSAAGPLIYNPIGVTQQSTLTGSGLDAFGLIQSHADSLRVTMTVAGPATNGPFVPLVGAVNVTATGSISEPIGLLGAGYANVATGITAELAGLYGFGHLGPSGSIGGSSVLVGVGAEVMIESGGSAPNRFGLWVRNIGAVAASSQDAAIGVSSGTSGQFSNLIELSGLLGASPLATTANFFNADAAYTVANVFNLPSLTVTGDYFNFANLVVTGAGVFTTPITQTINQSATTLITVNNNSTGVGALAALEVNNSANLALFGIGGTGYTGNTILQNRAFISAASGSAGIVLNNAGANPIIFSMSGTEVGRWESATPGQLNLGVAGATVGRLTFLNATSGSISLVPPTGALGTAILTLPDATDTLVGRATTDTLTNKSIDGSEINSGTLSAARLAGLNNVSGALGGDVTLNNTGTYFDGPSIAQGSSGTWSVCGHITAVDTAGSAGIFAKLWDGTTVIASGAFGTAGANFNASITLCGVIASPAGNLRVSVKDASSTSGAIKANTTGLSEDSTITAFRIQ